MNPTTPSPPDRAQSNESVPQIPAWIKEAVHLLKLARVLTAEELEGAAGVIHSVYRLNLPYMAAPPVSQRATGVDMALAAETWEAAFQAFCDGDTKEGTSHQRASQVIFEALATPRSLPHGPGLRGKIIMLGEITYDDFGTMRTHPGAIIKCTVEQIQQAHGNLIYREVELTDVPAVDGSKGAS